MATKLDKQFADGIKSGVQALIWEVERLEDQVQRVETALESVESFIQALQWSPGTPDIHITLVAGNIRNFAANLMIELHKVREN